MNEPFQLVTNCTFKGKDYLVQMCVLNSKKLELIVTDKLMAEDWQCEYDASYIEALTHKTGNFKQFDVFITMLKSGLLKTSECITLDLLTLEDLEELRNKKIITAYSSSRSSQNFQTNKRYLILTYSVEFDRIHYPLPLEYGGPPNPSVLQSNIRRLEAEVERLKQKNITLSKSDEGENKKLKEKIKYLSQDNEFLSGEVQRLNKIISKRGVPAKNLQALQATLKKLEDKVVYERNHNNQCLLKLKTENKQLKTQVEDFKKRERTLRMQLREAKRQISQKDCKRSSQVYQSPDGFPERRTCIPVEHRESLFFRSIPHCSSPTLTRIKKTKNIRKVKNRFLSSSSSESEALIRSSRRASEEIMESNQPLNLKSGNKSRNGSRDRSRHSSDGSREKLKSQVSLKALNDTRGRTQDGKKEKRSNKSANKSRDSSTSSRCSSKLSKISRLSKRGSGDHPSKEKIPNYGVADNNKEDLETRIHALQKLLSEGLKF